MKKGALPEKTVLGVPAYGRAFTLMNPHDHKMGARAKTTSFQVKLKLNYEKNSMIFHKHLWEID